MIPYSPVFTACYTFTIPYLHPRKTENQYHTMEYGIKSLFQKDIIELCFQTLRTTLTHSHSPLLTLNHSPNLTHSHLFFSKLSSHAPTLIHLHPFFTQPIPNLWSTPTYSKSLSSIFTNPHSLLPTSTPSFTPDYIQPLSLTNSQQLFTKISPHPPTFAYADPFLAKISLFSTTPSQPIWHSHSQPFFPKSNPYHPSLAYS